MATTLPSNTRALLARSRYTIDLNEFARWLADERYTSGSAHRHLTQLDKALSHIPQPLCTKEELHEVFAAVGRGVPSRPDRFRSTERLYGRFLVASGRLTVPKDDEPFSHVCTAYEQYLRDVCGLAASSRLYHVRAAQDFLRRSPANMRGLHDLGPQDIEQYVALRSREMSQASLQSAIGHLRGFLRYCHARGHIAQELSTDIEAPRVYRDEMPPQALDWGMVQALLRSIDLNSKAGHRDHFILHLMVHYGLRPSEVTSLQVDSINWDSSVLRVVQSKTRSDLLLPLMPQTMRILRSYLEQDRSAQGMSHPQLFLKVRCPGGPLGSGAIGSLFEKRVQMAKLPIGGHHVYRLRHTFAMRLLTQGVGIKAIGDLLGHHCIESTSVYLRLDIDMLQGVALEVPCTSSRLGDCHA